MKRFQPGRLAVLLCPLVLAVGCASGPPHSRAARELGDRLQARLTPAIANGVAGLDRLPNGARVVLSDQVLFAPGSAALDERGRYLLASVMEGLLAPRLLQIDVTDAPGTPVSLHQARTQAVMQFLRDYEIGPGLQFAALRQGDAPGGRADAPPGVAITVMLLPKRSG
jgi:hypothetical protein